MVDIEDELVQKLWPFVRVYARAGDFTVRLNRISWTPSGNGPQMTETLPRPINMADAYFYATDGI
jgi:hypothetical protein